MRRPRKKCKFIAGAFIIVAALTLSPVLQARPQECGKPTPPQCKDDCTGKKWYHDVFNKTGNANTCQPCTAECGPGFKLIGTCGGSEGSDFSCEPLCTRGYFCDQKKDQCTGCGICDHTVGDVLCNATHDTICGPCRPGFYHLKDHPGLCHPCDYHPDPEREPQCQKKEAPTMTPFTDKSSHLEQSSTESSVVGEPVPEDDQVDESELISDKGFTLKQYILVGACALGLLSSLVAFFVYRCSIQQKRRRQTPIQSQRQNYHDNPHEHACIEEAVPNNDANCNEERVSIDERNGTAHFQRNKSPHSPTSGTSLNQGFLSKRSHSHSHLPQHVFLESVNPSGSSGYISGDSQRRIMSYFSKQVPSSEINPSCIHTSTSMGNILVHDEPEVFYNKPIARNELALQSADDLSIIETLMSHEKDGKCSQKSHQKMHKGQTFQELPDEMKPLMMGKGSSTDDHFDREEDEKSLYHEENQPVESLKSEAASVAVQCPSLQNLASNDGTNLGDSDKVSKNGKRCTAKPELEATVCVPRQVQTEPVSDMLPSDSSASADGPLTSANASRISTSDVDDSSTPKAAEPETSRCKQEGTQPMHPDVQDTQVMQLLDKILTVAQNVSSAFRKASAERSPASLSTNREASAACSPEKKEKSAKKSEKTKLGDGPESAKSISVSCTGNKNKFFIMNNSRYNDSSSDSDETE